MLQFLMNMSIARRLTIAATITALIPGIVIFVLGSSYVSTLSTVNSTVQVDDTATKLVTDMQADLLRMNALLGTLSMQPSAVASNTQNSQEIRQLTSDFAHALGSYQRDYQIMSSAKMQSIRDALKNDSQGDQEPVSQHSMVYVVNLQWKSYQAAQEQILRDVQGRQSVDILAGDLAQANLEYLPLKGNLDTLVEQTESISQIVVNINTLKVYPIFFWTIGAFLFSTLVVFASSYLINLSITRPLRQLTQITRRIAQGDTNARALVAGHDETYMVATSMNVMLDSLVSLMKNIQQQHDCLEGHVQKLIGEVKGLGSGDLRLRAEVTSDTLGFLAHSFNYIIDELSSLVVPVKTATTDVEVLLSATQARIQQLAQLSAHQIQDTTEAVNAVEQMTRMAAILCEQARTQVAVTREMQKLVQSCRDGLESACQKAMQVREGGEDVRGLGMEAVVEQLLILRTQSGRLVVDVEQQQQVLEGMQGSLYQQGELAESVLRLLQDAVEANRKSSVSTSEASSSMGKLTHSVELLHTLVGTFKL